ncbi:MAG: protein kinase, partial [Gemmatimonadota bacterium]
MIDETISHYKILEKLGEGGMGVVYKAEDIKLKRTVALKFLPTHLTTDREARERFQREAQAVAALSHPNIITIYEIGEYEEQIFTALEYIEGESLQEKMSKRVKNSPSLTVNEIFSITIQICEGLSKAHKGGIVHRDIKPGNIFIDRDGQVKILDFGLAKLKWVSGITKQSSRLGTICYMSPEQIHGDEVDYRTDIWSVGVVLYQMLTGELPFKGDYEQIVVYQIINVKPEAVSKLCPGISQKLEQVVNRTLEKERVNRYHHIDELKLDLKRLVEKAEEGDHSSPKAFKRESIIKEIRQVGKKDYYRTNILKYVRILLSPRRNKILLGIAILLFLGFFLLKPIFFEKALVSEALSIAVISFENKTGDKAYDYLQAAIPNLLITSLEQSKYLRVTTWERLFDLLKQIGKGDIEFIDRSLGIELCHMDGVDAVVWGSFIKNGNVFTMELKVLDLNTENIVKTASSKGEGVSSILSSQIDELSREISRGMGISDRIIKSAQIPIAEVTTTSMDAYNYFLRGREDWEKFYHDDARYFLKKAVKLDSTFAVAYLFLASSYGGLGDTKSMINAYEKAMTYAQKASNKERLYIEAEYANIIECNP